MKRCAICGADKPIDEFQKRSDAKDGRRNQCRDCRLNAVTLICQTCGASFSAPLNNRSGRKYCQACRYPKRVEFPCEVCGTVVVTTPSNLKTGANRKRYCSKPCATIGQRRCRKVWNKGLTKADHPSLQKVSDAVKETYRKNPDRTRGPNHPMFGKHHTAEMRAKMSEFKKKQKITPGMLKGLKAGGQWCKGLTKHDHQGLVKRGQAVSKRLRGTTNPQHSERMKQFYEEHPEKHPNRIVNAKGYETKPERFMREGLQAAGIVFECQHRIASFFADFAVVEHRLVIEVDGAYWHDATKDAQRDAVITAAGWTVLRFTEGSILRNVEACVQTVVTHLLDSTVHPTGPTQSDLPLDSP